MRLRSTTSFVLAALVFAGSCTSESTEPTGDPSTLSFTYSGYRNGTYTVTGFQPDLRTGTLYVTPWASAVNFAINDQTFTEISSSLPAGPHVHVAQFVFPFGVTGTFPLGPAHADGLLYDGLSFEVDPNGLTAPESYLLSPGTVTITSTSSNRVVGTFSGTAVDSAHARRIDVTNGTFNIYLAPLQ
jgi:hypothetical protein